MRVVTVGTFDPVHEGHRALFADMRTLAGGDEVVVGVNSDAFYRTYRGQEPMWPLTRRRDTVAADPSVDVVYVNDVPDMQTQLIADCAPALLLIGLDWAHDGYLAQIGAPNWEWFPDHGIIVAFTPRHGTVSGSALREAARG
jgi:cytidyltransferase-like protein